MGTQAEATTWGLPHLTTAQRDRGVGAVVGLAVGDALGAGYEYGVAPHPQDARMIGGGLGCFAPGEWTDDTTMAVPILQALAEGKDLLQSQTQDQVVREWVTWAQSAKDIGVTTRQTLRAVSTAQPSCSAREAADAMFTAGLASAGNGSLMRTTAIVLGYLDDPKGLTHAARTYSHLTHGDPLAADACVLYNHAQRCAILTGELDIRTAIGQIPVERRAQWSQWLDAAEGEQPGDFAAKNTYVVRALQAAWSAIVHADASGPEHLEQSIRSAVAIGGDTDTVAAIAGGLVGARWGVSAVPLSWRRRLHGCPGLIGEDLVHLASAALGAPWKPQFYPWLSEEATCVQHPHDEGVWIGDIRGLRALPDGIDAVVSLCRVGLEEGPRSAVAASDHVNVWLMDSAEQADNLNLDLVSRQAVDVIGELRREGKQVYLHCVQAHSRTPFIATLYGAQVSGRPTAWALEDVLAVLPQAQVNRRFGEILTG